MYSEYEQVPLKDGAFKRFSHFRDETVNEVINNLFTVKGKSLAQISFDDLNNKFDTELYVFTAGKIREIACDYFKAHESEIETKATGGKPTDKKAK
jgi:hypothetical protein